MEEYRVAAIKFVQPGLDERVVNPALKELPAKLCDLHPEILAPAPRRNVLLWQGQQRCRVFVTEDGFRGLPVAGRTIALLYGVLMDGKSGRVYSKFDEVADANVLLKNGMGNLEVVGVFGVHRDAVD